jgi:hypothetical protein
MPRGGARPGAGRPKGTAGLEKEALRARLRAMVAEKLDPMTAAQIANAQGLKYLIARDKKTGKFTRVAQSDARLEPGFESEHEVIEVWEKDPSIQAFTDLMNRTIDKPVETLQADVNIKSFEVIAQKIKAGRARLKR